jgi:orotate phosphoribosyltransferase
MYVLSNEAAKVAEFLLQIEAVVLRPATPFTWASGILSPIYCDNRKILSFPDVRNQVKQIMTATIKTHFSDIDVLAGVATGGIAMGVLVAQELHAPYIYVRSSAKGHGLQNAVEGVLHENQKVVVIEDLVSTGGSSLTAAHALKDKKAHVLGMVAIFTYGMPISIENFEKEGISLFALSDYATLIEVALQKGYINQNELNLLNEWRKSPQTWNPNA